MRLLASSSLTKKIRVAIPSSPDSSWVRNITPVAGVAGSRWSNCGGACLLIRPARHLETHQHHRPDSIMAPALRLQGIPRPATKSSRKPENGRTSFAWGGAPKRSENGRTLSAAWARRFAWGEHHQHHGPNTSLERVLKESSASRPWRFA